MFGDRTYSTRELAQMWNVSESTVKRWADTSGLACIRTPGGHRRFRLEDICEFQQQRAFEATGLLNTDEWENPDLEIWLNARNFEKVVQLLLYLASQNQRAKVRCLLERLYLRGMGLEDLYDEIIVLLQKKMETAFSEGTLVKGQVLLVKTILDESFSQLSTKVIRRRRNGRTALCASPSRDERLSVGILSKVLEIDGWESLNLGDAVPFETMKEIVEIEPVNLVCLYLSKHDTREDQNFQGFNELAELSKSYRIPILFLSGKKNNPVLTEFEPEGAFHRLKSFREYASKIHH
jgi:excisionase family DNA binding protein